MADCGLLFDALQNRSSLTVHEISRNSFSAVGKYIIGNALKGKLLSILGNELIDLLAQKDEYTTLLPFSVNMKTGNRLQQLPLFKANRTLFTCYCGMC